MGLFTPSADQAARDRWMKLDLLVSNGLRNFQILGESLKEIRDQQLYRFEFETFDECCKLRWKISVRHATRLITAFETAAEIGPVGQQDISERQLRPLAMLPIEQRRDAYVEALADGATPAAIERAVAKRTRKKKLTALKQRRVKVPGGTMIFVPNKHATSYEQMASDLLTKISQRQLEAA